MKLFLLDNHYHKNNPPIEEISILNHIRPYFGSENYENSYSAYSFLLEKNYHIFFVKDVPYSKEGYFSISHSENLILIALDENSCGCDIQYMKSYNSKIIHKVFTEKEMIDYQNSQNKEKYFYEIWTRKESLVKRKKCGFQTYPKEVLLEGNFSSFTLIDKEKEFMLSCSSEKEINYEFQDLRGK